MINVKRTIHPVGQGLFCTEKFHCDDNSKVFNVVYDCGSFNHDALSAEIKKTFDEEDVIDVVFISHLHYDHISGLEELVRKYHIRSVVMPQLSNNLLIEAFVYNCIHAPNNYVAVNQFIYQLTSADNNSDLHRVFVEWSENLVERNGENIDISTLTGLRELRSSDNIVIQNNNVPIWEYVPYSMISDNVAADLVQELSQDSMFVAFFTGNQITDVNGFLQRISNQDGRERCKEIYRHCIRGYSANEYSMPVYSGPIVGKDVLVRVCHTHHHAPDYPHCHAHCDMDCCLPYLNSGSLANCLYTGDFNANPDEQYYQPMVTYYCNNHRWERIKMIQVPHHGSKYNHNIDLYQERCWAFISCGLQNRYHHPHGTCVADIFNARCHCSIVNEHCQPLKIEMQIY